MSDKQLLDYLLKGPKDAAAAAPIKQKLFGDFAKMVNLAHDWVVPRTLSSLSVQANSDCPLSPLLALQVSSVLMFVLKKINRVSFGLLNAEDLEKALDIDPLTPKSRQLLAVPFVGKDVDSVLFCL